VSPGAFVAVITEASDSSWRQRRIVRCGMFASR
jgi:hypothetical protein